ncbi:MAG: SDR family NAD(P)-dependent oxidoreductase [Solirubrobacterales bacterium]|nr:SDR family NAD(P)-dependent oxidoreductase [Solirubrobacterales bacterium]
MPDLDGRTFLVTGANTGIGKETVRALAARGARVFLACRSESSGRAALGEIAA